MKDVIHFELMSEELAQALRLKVSRLYVAVIDAAKLAKYGIKDNHLEFELTVDKDKKLTLIGPTLQGQRPRGRSLLIGADNTE